MLPSSVIKPVMHLPEEPLRPGSARARAALYLRVSTQRQADQQVSLPDQHRHGIAYCQANGYDIAATFIEEGASGLTDRRPEFRRMIEAALASTRPFDLIIVHSFSRFFRDHFEFELNVRKLAKNGVSLVSVTQQTGTDPAQVMMRKVIALFDEYQSRENAKHVMRALKENARQGFWCGSTPPVGYRTVAAEQRGQTLKKRLAIDPEYADLVRLVYRLALKGCSTEGPMGVHKIAAYLNKQGLSTPHGGRWHTTQIHRMLTRRTYMGEHTYNRRCKSGSLNRQSEVIIVPVPPLISRVDFETVQSRLRRHAFDATPSKAYGPYPLLRGAVYCAGCGRVMTVRPAKGRGFRYYTCLAKLLPNGSRCPVRTIPAPELDGMVEKFIRQQLLGPKSIVKYFAAETASQSQSELAREAGAREAASADAHLRLCRIYDAIEAGAINSDDVAVIDRIGTLREWRSDHLRSMEALAKLNDRMAAARSKPELAASVSRKALIRLRENPAILKHLLKILVQRVDVSSAEIRLTCANSRVADVIFHLGAGTEIADVNWRSRGGLKTGDCAQYRIRRPASGQGCGTGTPRSTASTARSKARAASAIGK